MAPTKHTPPLFPGAPAGVTEDKVLFYAISPANKGVVFAEPERARYVSSLHYAKSLSTFINGNYCHIEPKDLPAILKALEDCGIRAKKAPNLVFY
jgi:hypothetical protein